jgi:hypothetical protein
VVSRGILTAVIASVVVNATSALATEPAARGPVQLFVGGEASASAAEKDRGYFNAEEYGEDTLRLVRLRATFELRVGDHVAALGEVRHTNQEPPRVYALYLRLRPQSEGPFDIQVGMVPPVFGAFPRRAYASEDPLIGRPLGYQYVTSLRADAAPRSLAELLSMRGRGWAPSYELGATRVEDGLPPVEIGRWDVGAQVRLRTDTVEAALGVGQGSPSDPRVRDNNSGKALSARVAWTPVMGLVAGVSSARGRYLDGALEQQLGRGGLVQQVWGADVEYSRGHWILRAEALRSSWAAPFGGAPLVASATMLEASVKVAPGLSLAGRADRLSFGDVVYGGAPTPWELPVTRLEAAGSLSPRRHLILKVGLQHNRRDGGYLPSRETFVVGQAVVWF